MIFESPKISGVKIPKNLSWNAKCPIFLGNFTPKTSNYCLKNRALGFPGCSNISHQRNESIIAIDLPKVMNRRPRSADRRRRLEAVCDICR